MANNLVTSGTWYVVTDQSSHCVNGTMIIDFASCKGLMIWGDMYTYELYKSIWRQRLHSFSCKQIFCIGGFVRVYPCALELQALSFHALFRSLYLCRAARGSADIPILPHAHTILLKHAVNLKRKRTLFTSKPLFHHLIVFPTSRCHTNIGFSQNSGT